MEDRGAPTSETPVPKILLDDGAVNERIVKAAGTSVDFRRVETASIKLTVKLFSADGKRFFMRKFNSFQLLNHFISTIARTRLAESRIRQMEETIRNAVELISNQLDLALDNADRLFKLHGITQVASCDTVPLEMPVHVLSSISRRYLAAICKLDQLMPILQTLEIYEVHSLSEIDSQRASLKRDLTEVLREARMMAATLRQEMGDLRQATAGQDTAPDPDQEILNLVNMNGLPYEETAPVASPRTPQTLDMQEG